MEKIENVKSPFICYVAKVIPLAFDESMSYYECLCNFYNYLKNEVMPAINQNADATKELQDLYLELKDYIDDYFENLNVEEEVDAKLDEMALNGTLETIIANYLQIKSTFTFDTVSDMKDNNYLINGMFAQTLGYNTLNDGGASKYKIRTKTNDDTPDDMFIIELDDNTLVAELIVENNKINVRQIGISGEDEDNTTVLTTLFAKGYDMYFPSGTYNITAPLTLISHKIEGNSSNDTIIKLVSETNQELINSNSINELEIKNICFDCGNLTNETKTAINLYDTIGLKILNCEFKNGYGGHLRLNGSENIVIDNCYFHDISGTSSNMGNAIYCHPTKNMTITHSRCRNIKEDFLYLDGNPLDPVKNIYVNNNYLQYTGYNNSETSANCIGINGDCQNIYITNNIINNNINGIKTAIRYDTLPSNVFILNNIIHDNEQNGLSLSGNNMTVSNNEVYNNGQDGIYFISANNISATNNKCYNNTRNGVYLNSVNYGVIDSCTIYDNNACGLACGVSLQYQCTHINISNCEIYQTATGTQITGIQLLYVDYAKVLSCNVYNNTVNVDMYRTSVTNLVSQLNATQGKSTLKSIMYSDEISQSGSYNTGDIILYTSPTANGYIGAVCVSGGAPGTWKEFGKIEN